MTYLSLWSRTSVYLSTSILCQSSVYQLHERDVGHPLQSHPRIEGSNTGERTTVHVTTEEKLDIQPSLNSTLVHGICSPKPSSSSTSSLRSVLLGTKGWRGHLVPCNLFSKYPHLSNPLLTLEVRSKKKKFPRSVSFRRWLSTIDVIKEGEKVS